MCRTCVQKIGSAHGRKKLDSDLKRMLLKMKDIRVCCWGPPLFNVHKFFVAYFCHWSRYTLKRGPLDILFSFLFFNFKNKVQFFSPMGGLHIFIIPHSCHYFCQLNHILESMITVMDRDISRATRGDSARERGVQHLPLLTTV